MQPQILNHTKTDLELSAQYANYKIEFIVDGIIKKLGKNLLVAERGTGKTRIALFIAYAIIYGQKSVFGYPINVHGDILFINLELNERDFKAFTDPIRRYYENVLGLTRQHQLHITSFKDDHYKIADIKLAVQKFKPMLTIIDSYKIYQSIICKESNTTEINNSNYDKVLKPLDDLVAEFDTTIFLINHTNKGTRKMESTADLMFGPGALGDFVDQITLLRKTINDNQRLIVPDKNRYAGEGLITPSLIEIKSSDMANPYPEYLYFELLERDVNEQDYLPIRPKKEIPPETKDQIIQYLEKNEGTMEKAAEKFLGNKNNKGTISKIWNKHRGK